MTKTKKQKLNNGLFLGVILLIILTVIFYGVSTLINKIGFHSVNAANSTFKPFAFEIAEVSVKATNLPKNAYKYNELVPREVQLDELYRLAERFEFNQELTNQWVHCIDVTESGFNNLAKNQNSTALGTCQYLIGTWQETESFKQHRIARTDYKASLWEMALDIANGETWRWASCFK